ncbi:hypothetical protein K439DRAFT_1627548, partial [Ramaria rubella]
TPQRKRRPKIRSTYRQDPFYRGKAKQGKSGTSDHDVMNSIMFAMASVKLLAVRYHRI